MKFSISPEIFAKWPEVKVGILVLTGIDNNGESQKILHLLRGAEDLAKKQVVDIGIPQMPEVAIWRSIYEQFGSNPKDFRSSVEALLRRAGNGKPLPQINDLVDLGNFLSLQYHLPAGVEDLNKVKGDILLAFADGTEKGTYLGSEVEDAAYQGEVIYKDAGGFICRRWNWREGERTAVDKKTKNAVLVLETMPPATLESLEKALSEAVSIIAKELGGITKKFTLTKKSPSAEFSLDNSQSVKSFPKKPKPKVKPTLPKPTSLSRPQDEAGEAGSLTAIPGPAADLQALIYKAVCETAGVCIPQKEIHIEHPAQETFGDYSTNVALVMAKQLKKNPRELAEAISKASCLQIGKGLLSKVEVAGPGFLNLWLKTEYFLNQSKNAVNLKQDFGTNQSGKGKKVALEHTNVNPNKALHIGHLRNGCIGQAIERLWEASGYNVEVQYYVDDTGEQVAGTVLALRTLDIKPTTGEKFDHFSWDMYARIAQMYETDAEVVQKKQQILHDVEQGNNEIAQFTKDTATRILYDNLSTCHWFALDYDVLIWESDIVRLGLWQKAFTILKKNPAFVLEKEGKNAGCWVIKDDLTGGVLGGDKVIVRSNGTVIYAGKDIAYHMWKFGLLGIDFNYREFPNAPQQKTLWSTTSDKGVKNPGIGNVQIVLNLIDVRQTFTLGSVKVALKALGYPEQASNMHHLGYGVVYLSEGSMKKMGFATEEGKKIYAMAGRKGIGIMADVLLDQVRLEVEKKFPDSADISQSIAVAAIKYGMLSYNTFSDIVFDLDQALDIAGNTGPYIQYTFARTQSVLRKAPAQGQALHISDFGFRISDLKLNPEELSVLRWLYRYPEVVAEAAQLFAPNLMCNYLFELSQRFNLFYQKHRILPSDSSSDTSAPSASFDSSSRFRLLLTAATGQVLKNGLTLLGISALDKM